eukprot:SAG31_NODE_28_length_32713_cov_39.100509_7_plen_73_part_00
MRPSICAGIVVRDVKVPDTLSPAGSNSAASASDSAASEDADTADQSATVLSEEAVSISWSWNRLYFAIQTQC